MYLGKYLETTGYQPFSAEDEALRTLVFHMRVLKNPGDMEYADIVAMRSSIGRAFNRCDELNIPYSVQNSALAYAEDTARDA